MMPGDASMRGEVIMKTANVQKGEREEQEEQGEEK